MDDGLGIFIVFTISLIICNADHFLSGGKTDVYFSMFETKSNKTKEAAASPRRCQKGAEFLLETKRHILGT